MNSIELEWLIATLMQVVGAALALGVLGLAYESSLNEHKPFVIALQRGAIAGWLATGGVVFALGVGFTRAGWVSKIFAAVMGVLLIGLAWTFERRGATYRARVMRQKLTVKSIGLLITKIWLGILVVLALLWSLNLGWHAYHLYGLARNLQRETQQVQLENIVPLIGEAADDVNALDSYLRPLFPIFNALQGIPGAGQYLGQVDPLLTYANGLAQAGKEIITGLGPLLDGSTDGTSELSLPERTSLVLVSGQEHFVVAAEAIGRASSVRSQIRSYLLPNSIRPLFLKLDERFDLLLAGDQFLQAAPGILGADQAKNYLVLAQNRDELRATGGFISGIGLVTVQAGKILQFTLGDSYAVDDFTKPYPSPPEPLKRFMLADYWVARDANWSPDFSTTAQQAQALYTLSTGIETQGVIAFNQLAVKKILEVIGPVQVPGTDQPVTAENVENYMRQAWAPGPEVGLSQEWWLHRKDFMLLLGNGIIEKVLSSSEQGQLINLAKAMADLLDQGQLLIYFNDTSAQAALEKSGWDGGIHPGYGDYLYLVDSNVGFNKVDSVIQRSLAYQVDLREMDHPTGTATITYQHTGTGDVPCVQMASYGNGTYQDMQHRCYWDYWRVFAPAGSELLSSTARPVAAQELLNGIGWSGQVEKLPGEANTQVFAGLVVLPVSISSQIDVLYGLPQSILHASGTDQIEYALRIAVQPGLQGLPFKLEILPPSSAQVLSASEGMQAKGANTWIWQGVIEKSTELKLTFSRQP